MLGKLIKYEFKATRRFMLLMFALLLILSGFISIGFAFNLNDFVDMISNEFEWGKMIFAIFAFIIVALFVVMNVVVLSGTFFYSISRLKNNLLGDEGYLMHTLPVKTRDHILAKNIVSVVWTVISVIVVGIAYIILFLGISKTDVFDVFKGLFKILSTIKWNDEAVRVGVLLMLEMGVLCLSALIAGYFHIYASMAIGYSSNTHRVIKSVGVYILFNILSSMLEVALMRGADIVSGGAVTGSMHGLLLFGIIISVISSVIYFLITNYFISRKLNLQ